MFLYLFEFSSNKAKIYKTIQQEVKDRIQKLISKAGISSRRNAEALIKEGRVKLNGIKAEIGDKADPKIDKIVVDGNIINLEIKYKVILVNKPSGIISTCHDPQGRKTLISLLPANKIRQGLHPVGRLDQNSRGAILLSNNGELTLKLTHPKYAHQKTYRVWVKGIPSRLTLREWETGIILDNKKTLEAKVRIMKIHENKSLLNIILREGRNRQIRRVANKLGHPVLDLQRIAIADISLKNLKEGSWRELEEHEWMKLIRI